MSKTSILSELKEILKEVHFGLCPETDRYVCSLTLKNIKLHKEIEYNSIQEILDAVISNEINIEDVDLNSVVVYFRDELYKTVIKEYNQKAIKIA